MAQEVGYFEDNVVYEEGPFVIVLSGMQWRIEVELKGHHCPVLMHSSIYELLAKEELYYHKMSDKEKVIKVVDWLNQQVRENKILLHEKGYYYVPSV